METLTSAKGLEASYASSLQKHGKPALVENVGFLSIFSVFWRLYKSIFLAFSKAYDFMTPEKSRRLLLGAGIPGEMADVFGDVWSQQVRHVNFDSHVCMDVLTTDTAHPQGGPWGPVVIQLWMIAGMAWTKKQLTQQC